MQAVISRMGSNSFAVKGWTYGITGAVLALTKDIFFKPCHQLESALLCVFLLLIIFTLWYLDGFFLQQERQYRTLYEWLIVERPKDNLTSKYVLRPMHVPEVKKIIELDPKLNSIPHVLKSRTLAIFYCPLMGLILALLISSFLRFMG